jgi:hypothetical protein
VKWATAFKKEEASSAKPVSSSKSTKREPEVTRGELYVRSALLKEVDNVARATEGGRHEALNKGVHSIAGYIHTTFVSPAEIRSKFTAAARAVGLPRDEIEEVLAYALKSGREAPRDIPREAERDDEPATDSHGFDDEHAVDVFGRVEDYGGAESLDVTNGDERPTADDPLRGLGHLAAVALMGRARILDLARRPVSYVWQDIAAPGTIVLVAGKSGDGKTTLLFLVLGARANLEAPITLLGREILPAPPGQFVVLIEGEHSEASAARKLVQSIRLLGVDDLALDRVIIVARKAVRLGSPEWGDVVRLVAAGLVSDIAIDTVARVAPGDADSEREQVAIFEGVAQAIERAPSGVTPPIVWAVAHLRKGNAGGGLDEVSGSAQRVGQADSVLMLAAERADGRVVSSTVTFAKLREDPEIWPEPAEIVIGRDGTTRTLRTGAIAACQANDRPLEERILDLLAVSPKTKNGLSEAVRRSKEDVDAALTILFEARAIETTNVQIRGRNFKGFKRRESIPDPTPDPTPDPHSHRTHTGRTPDDTE